MLPPGLRATKMRHYFQKTESDECQAYGPSKALLSVSIIVLPHQKSLTYNPINDQGNQ